MKTCTRCKETLVLAEFRKQQSTKDGLKYYCKKCDNVIAKKYYEKNKKKIITKVTQWQKDNPAKVRDYKKSYYGKNKQPSGESGVT